MDGRRISTHSCKATCISWCAKHDVSPEHRAILARHSTSAQGPTALYSRDLITAALRSLILVLEAIRALTFFPDRSRSGMITPVPAPKAPSGSTPMPATPFVMAGTGGHAERSPGGASIVPSPESPLPETPNSWQRIEWPEQDDAEQVHEDAVAPDLLGDWNCASSDSSQESSSDSDVEVQWEQVDLNEPASQPSAAARVKWYINGKTLVNHERRNEVSFKCGRTIGASYFPVHQLTGLRCNTCFADAF